MRHYGIHDGLPSPQVRAITQGEDGRLWIAGPAGVAAYDGRSWQEFGLASGLSWGDQTALVWDDGGRLVSVSHRPPYPATRRQGSRWEKLPSPLEDAADAILFGVVASPEGALAYATDRGLFLHRLSGWTRLGVESGLTSPVRSLASWRGGLALATDQGVSYLVDGGLSALLQAAELPSPTVLALATEAGGESLWIAGEGWIGRLKRSGFETVADGLDFRRRGQAPVELLADGLGGVYLCGVEATADWVDQRSRETGLVYFHPLVGLQPLGSREALEAGRVSALFRDREDNVWLGGERGLTKIASRRFGQWDRRLGLLDDAVYSATERRDGSIVLGHRGGLSVLRFRSHVSADTRSLPLSSPDQRRIEPVRDMAEDEVGVLWLAAESAGVLALPTLVSEPRRYTSGPTPSDAFAGNATSVAVAAGRVWVGTDQGVYVADHLADGADRARLRFVRVHSEATARADPIHVRQMEPDGDGVMVASTDGVYRLAVADGLAGDDGESRFVSRRWHCRRGGACTSTFGLLERADGEWWVGTADGVYRFDTRGAEGDFVRAGLGLGVEEPVFFLLDEPTQNAVWLGTGNGVLRLRQSGDDGRRLLRFSVEDGLAGRETNRAAAFQAADGRLWMGTDGGVSVFDPTFDREARQPPFIRLVSVEAGGRAHDPNQPLRLAADDNDLSFHIRAVSLVDEDRVLLRRKLEGEEEWSEPFRNDPVLRYSNLRAGTYRLHLQASGADGVWSPATVSAPVTVRAPFWSTPWFLAVLTLTAGCLTWGLVTLVSQRRYFHRLRQDVADRTSALQASEDRYRKTFKAIDDGVVATDGDGRVQLLNPTAQRLTGWSEEEARGRLVEEVLNVYLALDSDLSDERGFTAGKGQQPGSKHQPSSKKQPGSVDPPTGERMSLLGEGFTDTIGPTQTAVMESRDGRRRHIEMSTSPIASRDAGVTGLVFVFRDVTRKRRIEEELSRTQKLEAVGVLAGGIAHDFNNLLTVLMGNLSLIQDSIRLDPDTAKALADAETALVRARDLTQQLLTFSRGGAPVRETAKVSEVLRDSASFVLRGSKVRFELDMGQDLWLVDIDAGQISQVMQNLLLNADQAMPSGGTVHISARNVDRVPDPLGGRGAAGSSGAASKGRFVRIDVRDEGIGIPQDLQMRVFDPYFSTKEEGRGLGLASAYAIVRKHDGLLTVRSSPGRGTTFSIFLPGSTHGLREGSRRDPSGPIPTGGLPEFAGRRILLMDDDRVVRRTAGAMLERLGCEVVHAENGARVMSLYEEALDDGRRFDAVLMDLTVPGGMGGQEAVLRLRAIDENAVAVVYSGYSTDPVLAEYSDYGFDGRLSKPFRIRELAAVLEEVLTPGADRGLPRVDAPWAVP